MLKKIPIASVCNPGADHHVALKVGDQVQWKAPAFRIYTVLLPGGIFDGFPIPFALPIAGPATWLPEVPLKIIAAGSFRNYIFDETGKACNNKVTVGGDDDPPEIVISSGLRGKGSGKPKK